MIRRKPKAVVSSAIWPYTPEASPRLSPIIADLDVEIDDILRMPGEEYKPSRPISLTAPRGNTNTHTHTHTHVPSGRPTLEDVLANQAPQPYTLAAYMAFLSQQHCLETLEFTLEAQKYREKYDDACAHMAGMPLNYDSHEGEDLQEDWTRILNIYLKPGAPREINLPAEERDNLLDYPCEIKPPDPDALKPAVKRMYDLMSDSIFIPFCNSLKPASHAQTYSARSSFGGREDRIDASRSTYAEQSVMHQHRPPRRRRSPPTSSHSLEVAPRSPTSSSSSSHRYTQSSSLSTALNRAASHRVSANVSHTSVVSDSAVTDDSASGDSPSAGEPMTPPTTPPTSDIPSITGHLSASPPKTARSDSGNWRKIGTKIWGKKKSANTLRERADED